jgi:hypothetical protein
VKTVAEAAQEVAVSLANHDDVVAFERALDGLVRHARLDRAALSKALAPVKRPRSIRCSCQPVDLHDVATVVRGGQPRQDRSPDSPPWNLLMARLAEAMELIESGGQPFLLALPTLATGALDAAVLVERMAQLEALGVTPAQADFAQALLRVTPTADEQVRRAAGELRSDAGRRLARWLREGGLPHRDSTPEGWPVSDPVSARPGESRAAQPELDHDPQLPPLAAALVGPWSSYPLCGCTPSPYAARFWAAQLPHHRDEVAARLSSWERNIFPCLAESAGPAGYAVHQQLAVHLGSDPDTAADALLVLAARRQLDSALLAGQLEVMSRRRHGLNPNRVTDALRTAADTGAHTTVWSVLEAALPALLRDEPVRGAGAYLALAVECASKCGAEGRIAEVDAVAERAGSSQTVKHARLLRDVLRRPGPPPR